MLLPGGAIVECKGMAERQEQAELAQSLPLAEAEGLLDRCDMPSCQKTLGLLFERLAQVAAISAERANMLFQEVVTRIFDTENRSFWEDWKFPVNLYQALNSDLNNGDGDGSGNGNSNGNNNSNGDGSGNGNGNGNSFQDACDAVAAAAEAYIRHRKNSAMQVHPVVQNIYNYIAASYHEDISLKTLSSQLHFSPSYLGQIFKQHTGRLFSDYLCEYRIRQAKQLLAHSTYKSRDIAAMVGFQNANYFANVFRKVTGVYPTVFRREQAANGETAATGAAGMASVAGATGAMGAAGTASTAGATGATGAAGTASAAGATGAAGMASAAGATGATGAANGATAATRQS
jgi:AraC-like DNA-binding protein